MKEWKDKGNFEDLVKSKFNTSLIMAISYILLLIDHRKPSDTSKRFLRPSTSWKPFESTAVFSSQDHVLSPLTMTYPPPSLALVPCTTQYKANHSSTWIGS